MRELAGLSGAIASVLVCGPIPPPVHGMAVATRAIVEELREHREVLIHLVNTSPGSLSKTARYHARKVLAISRALFAVGLYGSPNCTLYLPVENGLGICYSLLIATAARLRGMPLVLHHHSMAYLREPWRLARFLVKCAGPAAVHVIICEVAAESLRKRYPDVSTVLPLSNAFLLPPAEGSMRASDGTLRLGHLGNLSAAKGIDLVLETMRAATRHGVRVRLDVAGTVSDSQTEALLTRFGREFPGDFAYHGPLFEADKARFYSSIDVFLFPSRLPEIEGIVNLEAMRGGAVPIAFGHGCVESNLEHEGGVCINPRGDYVTSAVAHLSRWAASRTGLDLARQAARKRYEELRRQAEDQLRAVLEALLRLHSADATLRSQSRHG